MLVGQYDYAIDAKGRLNFPARFRDAMGETFIVTRWLDHCLAAFPADMIQQAFHKGKAAIMARSGILVAGIAQTNDDTTKIHDSFLTGEERVAGRDHWPAPPHGQLSWRPRRERGWPDGHPEAARYNVFPGPSPRRTSPRSEVW